MAKTQKHRWQFTSRFKRNAFGWRSQPAIQRVHEALSEIRRVRRTDPVLAAEGAVLFLERISPALEHVDSSSGAIGTAVNHAIEELVAVIAKAPAQVSKRAEWLERLWEAYIADAIPYIETLGEFWGQLCATKELASAWADRLVDELRENWENRDRSRGHYFQGTPVCLSSLLAASRYEELLEFLEKAPVVWTYRRWGIHALVALGKKAEAIRYAEASCGLNDDPVAIARACEQILLSSGLAEEAYERYAIRANRNTSYLASYRAIVRKYPHKEPAQILRDLVRSTPGEEGKWFAAAKDAGLFDLAIELANYSPCDPRTLARAARDFEDENPSFALEVGLAALNWLDKGYGYEITIADVWTAYSHTMKAAEHLGRCDEARERIRGLAANDRFVIRVLGRELGVHGK